MRTIDRDIAPSSWTALLERMGKDAREQAEAYEVLRGRLLAFFRYRGWSNPEELVDATFDRVGTKLAEGVEVRADVPRFALGVARFVHLEFAKRYERERAALHRVGPPAPDGGERLEHERRLAALEACLGVLTDGDRSLLARYHADRGQTKIDERRQLAESLGMTLNALRLKTFRLRNALQECVRSKIEAKRNAGTDHPPGEPRRGRE